MDIEALERLLGRHEVKTVGLQTACQNPPAAACPRSARPPGRAAVERNFFVIEDRVYADMHSSTS